MSKVLDVARYKYLCNLLLKARQDKQLSQRALAEKIKMPHTVISKIENFTRRIDAIELLTIADALDLDPCELLRQVVTTYPAIKGNLKKTQ